MTDSNDDRTRVVPKPGQPPTTTGDMAATVITAGATPVTSPATGSTDAGLLPVGSRLAEFEITRVIGQGGFGVVYEAWDHTLERVVAIKEYLPTSLSTRQQDGTVVPLSERHRETFDLGMRSFINEARLLAQFDHPSLLKVYRFWQEKGTTYMVMPFYKGDTLREALVAIPAGVDEAWLIRIMDGVTQALAVMHNANCYHRDIAPDNIILLEGSGRPVVLDFGAARRVITDKTQAITVILKPGYAPIEQYAEMPDMSQGAWTDVYALAAVMHVAVCGRAPPPSVARLLSDSYVPLAGNDILRQRYSPRLLEAIDAGLGVRPEQRPQSMAELRAALDLDAGARLCDLADEKGVLLAVNQNGRWAPHLAWMREAVRRGLIGDVQSCNISIFWDHGWIAGTPFEAIDDLVLYDFAVHWFDFLASLIGAKATSVFATTARAAGQQVRPPMLAGAMVAFDGGQASLMFDGATRFGAEDRTAIVGSAGTLASRGPDLSTQQVTLATAAGISRPQLEGTWFEEGFAGTMGALLKAVEDGTQPLNDARRNLDALALVFAAIASARGGKPVVPGTVRSLAAARG